MHCLDSAQQGGPHRGLGGLIPSKGLAWDEARQQGIREGGRRDGGRAPTTRSGKQRVVALAPSRRQAWGARQLDKVVAVRQGGLEKGVIETHFATGPHRRGVAPQVRHQGLRTGQERFGRGHILEGHTGRLHHGDRSYDVCGRRYRHVMLTRREIVDWVHLWCSTRAAGQADYTEDGKKSNAQL